MAEVPGRMWEFESITGKTLQVTDDEIAVAYKALFPERREDAARLDWLEHSAYVNREHRHRGAIYYEMSLLANQGGQVVDDPPRRHRFG